MKESQSQGGAALLPKVEARHLSTELNGCVQSRYLPAPTSLQRWGARHGRAIRVGCALFAFAVLGVQALAVTHGEATAVTWMVTFGSILSTVGLVTGVSSLQQYVTRWDANHDDGTG